MKTKTLKILLAAVTVVSLALAIYCLVVSIKGSARRAPVHTVHLWAVPMSSSRLPDRRTASSSHGSQPAPMQQSPWSPL